MVDLDRAEAEVQRVVTEKPHWGRIERRMPNLHQGNVGTAEPPRPPSFGETIKKALRGG